MGRIRAHSAALHPQCEVAAVADTNLAQAESLAAEAGCSASADWSELIRREDIDTVVVGRRTNTSRPYLWRLSRKANTYCAKSPARAMPRKRKKFFARYMAPGRRKKTRHFRNRRITIRRNSSSVSLWTSPRSLEGVRAAAQRRNWPANVFDWAVRTRRKAGVWARVASRRRTCWRRRTSRSRSSPDRFVAVVSGRI